MENHYCSICGLTYFIDSESGRAKHGDDLAMDCAHEPEALKPETDFDSDLDKIIYFIGKTFFVLAFADENESAASMGGDFFDVCPDGVPRPYLNTAKDAAKDFHEKNGIDLSKALVLAAKAEGIDEDDISSLYLEDFAHRNAMDFAGTGCCWTDNHEEYLIDGKIPKIGCFTTML